jgi:hypothetical protein
VCGSHNRQVQRVESYSCSLESVEAPVFSLYDYEHYALSPEISFLLYSEEVTDSSMLEAMMVSGLFGEYWRLLFLQHDSPVIDEACS